MKRRFSPSLRNSRERSGVISIAVLALILLTSAVSIELVHSVIQMRQAAELRELGVQAELLAQSGLDRAAFQLKENPERQEFPPWTPPSPDGEGTALVTYQWERTNNSSRQKINVFAELTNINGQTARHQLIAEIDIPSH